ncbi:MAG TPA: response regulator transcription factor [Candidatus Kapabacteria bacterium]|nr:response regulator transcription factor [Candidatus Kapabacteria bacterium]
MSVRIVIADDHKLMREGLSSLLNQQPDIQVVGQATNGREAVQLTERETPDVVVMDVSMPDLNGIDATRQIISRLPRTKVIALSMHSDRQFVAEMFRVGARGYLLKDSAFEDLTSAISKVMDDEIYIAPGITGFKIEEYSYDEEVADLLVKPRLSEREREVLQMMAEGKGTKEIAAELHLSAKTVETHRQHLMDKLDMYSVAELTKFAIREGLTTLDH